jgi:hypothetical protein
MKSATTSRQRRPKDQKRIPLSMRITPELRDRLVTEAGENGRSITQEAEIRLQQSFREQNSLDQALDFKYGRDMVGVLLLVEHLFGQAEAECNWTKSLAGQPPAGQYWANDPFVFEQTMRAVVRALDALRPAGDSSGPLRAENGEDVSGLSANAGARAAATFLAALVDPAANHWGRWARPIAARLGPELVERIQAAEHVRGAEKK